MKITELYVTLYLYDILNRIDSANVSLLDSCNELAPILWGFPHWICPGEMLC